MKVKTVVTRRYIGEEGFEFAFSPIEDTITIKKIRGGYEARYLVQDDDASSPDENADDNTFLVHYHRNFWVTRDNVITKGDLANWYHQDFSDYDDGKFPWSEKYHIFPVSAIIHSGVCLQLGKRGFSCDPGGWDTSHVGAIFIAREEWRSDEDAYKYASGVIDRWNYYLSGDVYGIVKETYDKHKAQIDHDSRWGFYGHKYALEQLADM